MQRFHPVSRPLTSKGYWRHIAFGHQLNRGAHFLEGLGYSKKPNQIFILAHRKCFVFNFHNNLPIVQLQRDLFITKLEHYHDIQPNFHVDFRVFGYSSASYSLKCAEERINFSIQWLNPFNETIFQSNLYVASKGFDNLPLALLYLIFRFELHHLGRTVHAWVLLELLLIHPLHGIFNFGTYIGNTLDFQICAILVPLPCDDYRNYLFEWIFHLGPWKIDAYWFSYWEIWTRAFDYLAFLHGFLLKIEQLGFLWKLFRSIALDLIGVHCFKAWRCESSL